ncbi:MAG: TonB family protein [Nannocystaceae bacterium]
MSLRPVHACLAAFALSAGGPWAGIARAAEPAAEAPSTATLTPPARIRAVDAVYPTGVQVDHEVRVELDVTVGIDGRVAAAAVHESGGPAFDASALAAVAGWEFTPARRGDEALAAKIRVPFVFPAGGGASAPPVPGDRSEGSRATPNEPVPGDSSAQAPAEPGPGGRRGPAGSPAATPGAPTSPPTPRRRRTPTPRA